MSPFNHSMLHRYLSAVVALLALTSSGCALDPNVPSLTPLRTESGAPVFRYVAGTTPARPADSESGERARITDFQRLLRDYGYDPSSYEVLSRAIVLRPGQHGNYEDIAYEIKVPTDPLQRMEFPGVSFVAPSGEGWFRSPTTLRRAQRGEDVASFFKLTGTETHSVLAAVQIGRIQPSSESALEQLKSTVAQRVGNPGRFHPTSIKTNADASISSECIRYDLAGEDLGVPGHVGLRFVAEQHGLICVHPQGRDVIMNFEYSERRLPSDAAADLAAEGERFLRSIRFMPLPVR